MEGALYMGNAGLKPHSDMKSLSPSINVPGYNTEWIKNATLNSLGRQSNWSGGEPDHCSCHFEPHFKIVVPI